MTDQTVEVFKGRDARGEAIARLHHPTAISSADLEGQFRIATAIANATEAVPRSYRKQPGAVLLALAWSQQHELDILTTIQNVAFIDGKAVVDATMQRALAKRAGYEVRMMVEADRVTVAIYQGGTELGDATYSMADAKEAGLDQKNNWKKNREDMLVARATTRAIRRFAPDVLLGMLSSDEVDEPVADVVQLAQKSTETAPVTAVHPSENERETAPEASAKPTGSRPESAPKPTPDLPWYSDSDHLAEEVKSSGLKVADAIRASQIIAAELKLTQPTGLSSIVAIEAPEFRARFLGFMDTDLDES